MNKIRVDQLDTFLEYLQEWIDRRIINMDSPDVTDHMNEMRAKETLREYIIELFEVEKI